MANELPPPIKMVEIPKLKMLMRGIQRAQVKDSSSRPRLPITSAMLRQIRALWSNHEHEFEYITVQIITGQKVTRPVISAVRLTRMSGQFHS